MNLNLAVSKILYGYLRQRFASECFPSKLSYGLAPQMFLDSIPQESVEEPIADHRRIETLALIAARAMHIKNSSGNRAVVKSSHIVNIDDFVLISKKHFMVLV